MAQIDIVHVPYKGASAAMTDLIGGQIQMMFAPILAMLPMTKAGKLKALGVTSAQRSTIAPDIPTIAEAGVPGYEVTGWYGFVAPAGTPRMVISRVYEETRKGLESPAMKERLKGQGLEPLAASPEESARFIKADIARWLRVIRAAGIRPE
jgi:tripartite-type tricarboxylate transporter receptor subunit TctC